MPGFKTTPCPSCDATTEELRRAIVTAREVLLEEERVLRAGGAGSEGDYQKALIAVCEARIELIREQEKLDEQDVVSHP